MATGKQALIDVSVSLPGYLHSPELTSELLDGWGELLLHDLRAHKLVGALGRYQASRDPAYWDAALRILAEILAAEKAEQEASRAFGAEVLGGDLNGLKG